MDLDPAEAVVDPSGAVELMTDRYNIVIGDVLVGLLSVDEVIDFGALDARSQTALRRMRCDTWADLARRRVSDLWNTPAVGRLTVTRVLTAAAERNRREPVADGPLPLRDASVPADPVDSPLRPDAPRFNRALRSLAVWAVRERGIENLGELLALSPGLGRLPPELCESFDVLRGVPLDQIVATESNDLPGSVLVDLLAVVPDRLEILVDRQIALGDRPTLEQLSTRYDVSRERIRQIEMRDEERIRGAVASHDYAALRWRADDLRDALGVAVPLGHPLLESTLDRAVRGLAEPGDCKSRDLMLWIAGPYRTDSGWLVLTDTSLNRLLEGLAGELPDTEIARVEDLRRAGESIGFARDVADAMLATIEGWRAIDNDVVVRWSGTVGDKAHVVLGLLGRPASSAELNDLIGEGHSNTSVSNALAADPRFARIDNSGRYALVVWGLEEYSGIAQEISQRIERDGGSTDLGPLVDELVAQFGVAANSVRSFASTPAFVVEKGRVRLRTDAEPFSPDTRVHRARGVYVSANGSVIVHDVIDKNVLRGSGRQFPQPAAAALGLRPGDRVNFHYRDDVDVAVVWGASSTIGPTIGSLRALATDAGLELGDEFRLSFDPVNLSCSVARVDPRSLEGLTGVELAPGQEAELLAAAVGVSTASLGARLAARGDTAVARMLPPSATGA